MSDERSPEYMAALNAMLDQAKLVADTANDLIANASSALRAERDRLASLAMENAREVA